MSDEQVRRLQARAAERGQTVEGYLLELAEREPVSAVEWEQAVARLHQLIPQGLSDLPDVALQRDALYRD